MKFIHLLICLLLLSSCMFEPDGLNYVEVEEPAPVIPVELSLSINEDSIYLYRETNLSFSLSTFGKELKLARIHYYNNEMTTDKQNYSFTIHPQPTSEWVDLTIDFFVSTGTGSIADRLNAENYVFSKTWKIKYIDLEKDGINTGYKVHPEGYLEPYIVKPRQLSNGECGLSLYGKVVPSSRTSGDTVFFADKTYCSGERYYNLWYHLISDDTYYNRMLKVDFPATEIKVEAIGLDSCKVTWTKSPFKLYYVLNDNLYKGFGNECNISIMVGEDKYLSLGVFPPDYQNQIYSSYNVGTHFGLGTNIYYTFSYSVEKDKFYMCNNSDLPYIESSGMPLPASNQDTRYNTKINILCSPNGKYIAGYSYSQIYVYDESLNFSKKISAGNIPNYRPYFSITNDGAFTYLQGTNIVMKNIGTENDWESFSFPTEFETNVNMVSFSAIANTIEGKYVCVVGMTTFTIYDVSDHTTAKVVYTTSRDEVHAVVAHPTLPEMIYVVRKGRIELRSCADFGLHKSTFMPISGYYLHSIDPYSNILLIMKDSYYYFLDPETETASILLKLKLNSLYEYNVILARNQFKKSQFVVDLTQYLKR